MLARSALRCFDRLRRCVRERLDPSYVVERTARVPAGAVDEIVRAVPPPPVQAPFLAGHAARMPPRRSGLRRSLENFDFAVDQRAARCRSWRASAQCNGRYAAVRLY